VCYFFPPNYALILVLYYNEVNCSWCCIWHW